ncbi:YceD family protein [Pacificimonas sp. ICDLI1SI03]
MTEFSRPLRLDEIGQGARRDIAATEQECAALADRFGLVSIKGLAASLNIVPDDAGFRVHGTLSGHAVAACSISAEDVPQEVREELDLLVTRDKPAVGPDEEIELDVSALDVIHIEGGKIDLGEIAADSFALALDPFPRADEETIAAAREHLKSEEEARAASEALKQQNSPFAALKEGK